MPCQRISNSPPIGKRDPNLVVVKIYRYWAICIVIVVKLVVDF